jgi:hypothetical protein
VTPFPVLRWAALAFVLVLVPAYAAAYGPANFAFLCNLSLFLTTIGLFTGSRLLLSSQAVGLLAIAAVWTLDLALRVLLGRHLIGGTEYMWDTRFPLGTRLLSFYHVAFAAVLLYALRRLGYDRRGYLLQCAIAVVAVVAGRLLGPAANVNHAFVDPVFRRAWGGAASNVAVIAGVLVLVVYPITHLALARAFRRPIRGEDVSPR